METFIKGLKYFIESNKGNEASPRVDEFYTVKLSALVRIPCNLQFKMKNGFEDWQDKIEFLDITYEETVNETTKRKTVLKHATPDMSSGQKLTAWPVSHASQVNSTQSLIMKEQPATKTMNVVRISIPLSPNFNTGTTRLNEDVTHLSSVSQNLKAERLEIFHPLTKFFPNQGIPNENIQHKTSPIKPAKKNFSQHRIPSDPHPHKLIKIVTKNQPSFSQIFLNPKAEQNKTITAVRNIQDQTIQQQQSQNSQEKTTPVVSNNCGLEEIQKESLDSSIYIDNAESNFNPQNLKNEVTEHGDHFDDVCDDSGVQEETSGDCNSVNMIKDGTSTLNGENSFMQSTNYVKEENVEMPSESDKTRCETEAPDREKNGETWLPDNKPESSSSQTEEQSRENIPNVDVNLNNSLLENTEDSETSKMSPSTIRFSKRKKYPTKTANENWSDVDLGDMSELSVDENDSDSSWKPDDETQDPVVQKDNHGHLPDQTSIQDPKIQAPPRKGSRRKTSSPIKDNDSLLTNAGPRVKRRRKSTLKFQESVAAKDSDAAKKTKKRKKKDLAGSRETKQKRPYNRQMTGKQKMSMASDMADECEGQSQVEDDSAKKQSKKRGTYFLNCRFCQKEFDKIRPYNIHVESHIKNGDVPLKESPGQTDDLSKSMPDVKESTEEKITIDESPGTVDVDLPITFEDHQKTMHINDTDLQELNELEESSTDLREQKLNEGEVVADSQSSVEHSEPTMDKDDNVDKTPKNYNVLTCENCNKVFTLISRFVPHRRICYSQKEQEKYDCKICEKKFKWRQNLDIHTRRVHPENSFPCNICTDGTKFKTRKLLRIHKATVHPNEKLHICHICGKGYNRKSKLMYHLQLHSVVRPYKCELCEKSFPGPRFLKVHCRSVHERARTFQCDTCGKSYKSKGSLNVHLLSHSTVRAFVCKICKMAFKGKRELQKHAPSHDAIPKLFPCETCGKSFSNNDNRKRHMFTAHNNIKPFHCEFCSKSFKLRYLLTQHSKVHKFEKDYRCQFCFKTFSFNSSLHSHLKYHHKDEVCDRKPTGNDVSCYLCGKVYNSNVGLSAHLRNHSNV